MIKDRLKESLYTPLSEIGMTTVVVDFDTFLNQVCKTYLDLSFQRDGGWDEKQKKSFLHLTKESGHVFSPIYICDNDECYKNSSDDETKDYFYDLLQNKGKRFLSIDGNNRSLTLLENKENILNENWDITKRGLTIIKITKIKKSGIPLLFNYLNSGLKQTNQVMRNTHSYNLGSTVYHTSIKYKSPYLFSKSGGKNTEELISRCVMIVDNYLKSPNKSYSVGLHTNNLDSFFLENSDGLTLHTDTIKILNNILSRLDDIIMNNVDLVSDIRRGQVYFLNMFMLLLIRYKSVKINDREFLKSYLLIESKLRSNSNIEYDKSIRGHYVGNVRYRYTKISTIIEMYEDNFILKF